MIQKQQFAIVLICTVIMLLYPNIVLPQQITGRKYLRVGELWTEEEDIPSMGWEKCFAWPGNHFRVRVPGEDRLMNGTVRQGGLSYGMTDWKDWKNNFFPYMVGGVNQSNLVHAAGARWGCIGHEFKVVLRQPPPTLIVDGEIQPPRQAYDELDPNLISDAKLYVRMVNGCWYNR